MDTLYTERITLDEAKQQFPSYDSYLDSRGGIPTVEITTMQRFGKKTCTGLQVSLVSIEDHGAYTIKNMCMSIPCVRLPFETPTPVSRKGFRNEVLKAFTNYPGNKEHLYYKILNNYVSKFVL